MASSYIRGPALEQAGLKRGGLTAILVSAVAIGVAVPLGSQGRVLGIDAIFGLVAGALLVVAVRTPFIRRLWLFCVAWCVSEIASDVIQGTKIFSQWSSASLAIPLVVTGLFWLYSVHRIAVAQLTLAVCVGWLGLELVQRQWLGEGNAWKFGVGRPISATALSLAYYRGWSSRRIALLLVGLAAVSITFSSRFYAGADLLAALILWTSSRERRRVSRRRALGLIVLTGACLYAAFPPLARSGALGQRDQYYQRLDDAQHANPLISDRLQFLQALDLMSHHSFPGIGSKGSLSLNEADQTLNFVQTHGRSLNVNDVNYLLGTNGYADHAFALDSAVHGGWAALLFWIFFYYQLIRTTFRRAGKAAAAWGLFLFTGLHAAWDGLFSPLSSDVLLNLTLATFLMCVYASASGDRRGASGDDSPSTYAS